MNWLSAEDWGDLQNTLLIALGVVAVMVGWGSFKRWKARQPIFDGGKLLDGLMNFLFFAPILLFTTAGGILERHGITGFYSFAIHIVFTMVLMAPLFWLMNFKRNKLQQAAKVNPDAARSRKVAPSSEEVKMNLKLNLLVIGFAILTIGPILYIAFFAAPLDLSTAPFLILYVLATMAALIYGIAGRWYGTLNLKPAKIDIAASPQQVWDIVRFRNTTNWWKKIVSRVEKLDQPGDFYKLHYFNNDICSDCGLPRDPDSAGMSNLVEVTDEELHKRLSWRAYPKGTGGLTESMMAYEDCTYTLEALPNGHTRLTSVNTVTNPRMFLVGIVKIGDPAGQELQSLKAHIDGTHADTVFDVGVAQLEEARRAEKFCGCAHGAPAAGLFR